MKAIPTGPLCLACHGETLAAPVAEKIGELYPADKATGFREGDIRGAFVVTKRRRTRRFPNKSRSYEVGSSSASSSASSSG